MAHLKTGHARSVLVVLGSPPGDPSIAEAEAETAEAVCDTLRSQGMQAGSVVLSASGLATLGNRLRTDPPDVVVNLCESPVPDSRGEMALPALLDLLRIPYTGSPALALGLALHKDMATDILRSHRVPTPRHALVTELSELHGAAVTALRFPLIVKPAREDASVGIDSGAVIYDPSSLERRVASLHEGFAQPALVEEYINGREICVGFLGDRVLPLREILFGAFFDDRPRIVCHRAKWDPLSPEFAQTVPVLCQLDRDTEGEVVRAATNAFAALGCRDYGRVDLRLTAEGRPYVIDVNPNCDLHPKAGYAVAAAAAGVGYEELVGRLVELAFRRGGHR